MEKDPNILTEIIEISPLLASLKNKEVLAVPEGYFEALPSLISDKIQTLAFDGGSKISLPNYEVPKFYFNNLPTHILQNIRASEEQDEPGESTIYPVLAGLEKKGNSLTVPPGYFENLSQSILEKVKEPAPVVSISSARVIPLYRRPVFRYAVAAAVTIIIFLGIFVRFGDMQTNDSFAVVNRKTVPDKMALKYNSEKSFEQGIASLTDDQIIAYLQNHGNVLDNGQLISNTNTSKMPEPQDYLLNEKTLDNYIRDITN